MHALMEKSVPKGTRAQAVAHNSPFRASPDIQSEWGLECNRPYLMLLFF
jgi:hypothetical protein